MVISPTHWELVESSDLVQKLIEGNPMAARIHNAVKDAIMADEPVSTRLGLPPMIARQTAATLLVAYEYAAGGSRERLISTEMPDEAAQEAINLCRLCAAISAEIMRFNPEADINPEVEVDPRRATDPAEGLTTYLLKLALLMSKGPVESLPEADEAVQAYLDTPVETLAERFATSDDIQERNTLLLALLAQGWTKRVAGRLTTEGAKHYYNAMLPFFKTLADKPLSSAGLWVYTPAEKNGMDARVLVIDQALQGLHSLFEIQGFGMTEKRKKAAEGAMVFAHMKGFDMEHEHAQYAMSWLLFATQRAQFQPVGSALN